MARNQQLVAVYHDWIRSEWYSGGHTTKYEMEQEALGIEYSATAWDRSTPLLIMVRVFKYIV